MTLDEYGPPVELASCEHCQRKFAAGRLAVHRKVCAAAKPARRKVFDAQLARWAQTGAEEALKFIALSKRADAAGTEQQAAQTHKWRRQSALLRQIALANRSKGAGAEPQKAPFEEEDDRIPCSHCGRRFAPVAHERHVLKCKDIRAKPTALIRSKEAAASAGRKAASPAHTPRSDRSEQSRAPPPSAARRPQSPREKPSSLAAGPGGKTASSWREKPPSPREKPQSPREKPPSPREKPPSPREKPLAQSQRGKPNPSVVHQREVPPLSFVNQRGKPPPSVMSHREKPLAATEIHAAPSGVRRAAEARRGSKLVPRRACASPMRAAEGKALPFFQFKGAAKPARLASPIARPPAGKRPAARARPSAAPPLPADAAAVLDAPPHTPSAGRPQLRRQLSLEDEARAFHSPQPFALNKGNENVPPGAAPPKRHAGGRGALCSPAGRARASCAASTPARHAAPPQAGSGSEASHSRAPQHERRMSTPTRPHGAASARFGWTHGSFVSRVDSPLLRRD
ncbi:hypothetical protein AB1Y20_001839 [Prymnesium parvum]|uniref:C2HC/C3H-type domain-containing protein n=1 Tax=Prymnesium parvum TaxID=97485 RepID=A0AB34KCH3_PRYPA